MTGWVRLHRKLLESAVFHKERYLKLWIYLLLKANHQTKEIIRNGQICTVKQGSFITGRKILSQDLKIPETTIERMLTTLENSHQIGQQKTSQYRLIIITKWEEYQQSGHQNGQRADNKRTTNGQLADTNKNDKNDNNDNNEKISMATRQKEFISLVNQFVEENPKYRKVKDQFIAHWTEPNGSKTKFRRETEKYFNLKKRLDIFLQNDESRNNKFQKSENNGTYKEKNYESKF